MKVKLQNRTIFILWQHHCFKKVVRLMKDVKGNTVEVFDYTPLSKKSTECTIYDEQNNILAQGISKLMNGDAYDKVEGRKLSLTYALRPILEKGEVEPFTREERIFIWEQYANTVRDPFNKKVRYDGTRSRKNVQNAEPA